jgi:hypothetical protein
MIDAAYLAHKFQEYKLQNGCSSFLHQAIDKGAPFCGHSLIAAGCWHWARLEIRLQKGFKPNWN